MPVRIGVRAGGRIPADPVTDPARWRIGVSAVAVDALLAAASIVIAYSLRFDATDLGHFLSAARLALALVVLAQLGMCALTGLYSHRGQVMWPVRLVSAAVGGTALGATAAFALNLESGLSRQALVSQFALFGLMAALWRSGIGLLVRRQRRQSLLARYGTDDLVVQGEDLASMTGGISRVWRYRHLLRNLVARDLHLKYRRSLLGFAWSVLVPLVMILVYAVAFRYVLGVATPQFVLFLLVGLLSWNFFAGAVVGATDAVSGGGSMLKSVVFPRAVLPLAVVLFHLSQYVLTMLVFLPVVLLIYDVPLGRQVLLYPVFLALQVTFITGLALALSAMTALFRDVRHLMEVAISVLFWATPIVYEMSRVPEQVQFLAILSPSTSYIRAYQDIFYYGVAPDLTTWVVAVAYAVGAFVCGLSVFLAYEAQFSELV